MTIIIQIIYLHINMSNMSGIGINGFGRIGRIFLREAIRRKSAVVAINDPAMDPSYMAYLLRYDSTHGQFKKKITVKDKTMIVDGCEIKLLKETDPAKLCWGDNCVHTVVECTGRFLDKKSAEAHLKAGAKRVVISAPSKDAPMFVCGVNLEAYCPEMTIISNSSCTTNCLAPLAKVIHSKFKIVEGLMTTVHAATASQAILDAPKGKDRRSGRSGMSNIMPASTGAAVAVGKVLPELNGKLSGMAFRVPIINVSAVDLTCRLGCGAKMKEINAAIKEASCDDLSGILGYTDEDVVSADINGSRLSSIFDAKASISLNDNFVKLISWYDNEMGYSCRLLDLVLFTQMVDKCEAKKDKPKKKC